MVIKIKKGEKKSILMEPIYQFYTRWDKHTMCVIRTHVQLDGVEHTAHSTKHTCPVPLAPQIDFSSFMK